MKHWIFSQCLFNVINCFINMLRKLCFLIFKIFNNSCKIIDSLSKSFKNIILLSYLFLILFYFLFKKSLLNLLLCLKFDCCFKRQSIFFFFIFLIFLLSLFDELFWLFDISSKLCIFKSWNFQKYSNYFRIVSYFLIHNLFNFISHIAI